MAGAKWDPLQLTMHRTYLFSARDNRSDIARPTTVCLDGLAREMNVHFCREAHKRYLLSYLLGIRILRINESQGAT
jgi:hypothetical protein